MYQVPEYESGNDKDYEVETIRDNVVYTKKTDGHLPGFYYLISCKGYPEEENTWEPSSTIICLRKIVNTSYRGHPEKPIITSTSLDSALPMAKPIIQLPTKRK